MFKIEVIHELVSSYHCEVRIKVRGEIAPSPWSKWISEPAANYIETFSAGPWPSRDIEWVDINPIALIYIGRLVKDKRIDNKEAIEQKLVSLEIPFESVDNLLRIVPNK